MHAGAGVIRIKGACSLRNRALWRGGMRGALAPPAGSGNMPIAACAEANRSGAAEATGAGQALLHVPSMGCSRTVMMQTISLGSQQTTK